MAKARNGLAFAPLASFAKHSSESSILDFAPFAFFCGQISDIDFEPPRHKTPEFYHKDTEAQRSEGADSIPLLQCRLRVFVPLW